MRPGRRWRKAATGVVVLTLLFIALSAWQSHRWTDPRFVGAWRVTNSKSEVQSIYILNDDGSARWLEKEGEGDQWWERGPSGAPFYWSIGRDGFRLQNLMSPGARFSAWLLSLGGLLNRGRLTLPNFGNNRSGDFEVISDHQIRLNFAQPGIIKPLILTLDRIEKADIPTPQP